MERYPEGFSQVQPCGKIVHFFHFSGLNHLQSSPFVLFPGKHAPVWILLTIEDHK